MIPLLLVIACGVAVAIRCSRQAARYHEQARQSFDQATRDFKRAADYHRQAAAIRAETAAPRRERRAATSGDPPPRMPDCPVCGGPWRCPDHQTALPGAGS